MLSFEPKPKCPDGQTTSSARPFPSGEVWMYGRYSDAELQSGSSIDQQVEGCRSIAARNGHQIFDDGVFADEGIKGWEENRPELNRLKELIREGRKCSDLYVFDSSRLARDTELAMRVQKFFDHHNVRVHYVASGMVSGTPAFSMQHAIAAAHDQYFSKVLGYNVRRGQLGQLRSGFAGLTRCYGYKHEDELNPAYADSFNRKRRKGVRAVIDPVQGEIVRRIFNWYLAGMGYDAIARELNGLGIKSPRKPTKNKVRVWSTSSVRTILNNRRYLGIVRYGATETLRNPETKKIVHRKRDQKDVEVFHFQELRIISNQEFEAVRKLRASRDTLQDRRKAGGLGKGQGTYIWSGLLKCGVCGSSISVCQPNAYMCTTFYKRGGCNNNFKLNRLSLERDFAEYLGRVVRQATSFDSIVDAVMKEGERQYAEAMRLAEAQSALEGSAQAHLQTLEHEIVGLATAIAKHGYSEALSQALREREAEQKRLAGELQAGEDTQRTLSELKLDRAEIAEFLSSGLEDMANILMSDPETCRLQIRQRVDHLILTPGIFENSPCYDISGDLRLFGQEKLKMLGHKRSLIAEHLEIDLAGTTVKLDANGRILRIARVQRVSNSGSETNGTVEAHTASGLDGPHGRQELAAAGRDQESPQGSYFGPHVVSESIPGLERDEPARLEDDVALQESSVGAGAVFVPELGGGQDEIIHVPLVCEEVLRFVDPARTPQVELL